MTLLQVFPHVMKKKNLAIFFTLDKIVISYGCDVKLQ